MTAAGSVRRGLCSEMSKDSAGAWDEGILFLDADGRVRDMRYVSTGFPG
ncbi:MAG: hypothetical protein M3417_15055 [Actinomycetota bacterium]|nr:hypothetical protein [Actinomycetota bacterium]